VVVLLYSCALSPAGDDEPSDADDGSSADAIRESVDVH
jgi:hypothetical protein